MNCMKRFTLGVAEDKYMVTFDNWVKEQDFAEAVIRMFNDHTNSVSGCAEPVDPMKGWPTDGYLRDIPRNFMIKRYGFDAAKDYRKWCRENPGKILVVEVFGKPEIAKPCALEMRYDKGFCFRLV